SFGGADVTVFDLERFANEVVDAQGLATDVACQGHRAAGGGDVGEGGLGDAETDTRAVPGRDAGGFGQAGHFVGGNQGAAGVEPTASFPLDRLDDRWWFLQVEGERNAQLLAGEDVPIEIALVEGALVALDVADAGGAQGGVDLEEAEWLVKPLVGIDDDVEF